MTERGTPDLWWAIPGVLAGMSRPYLHSERLEWGDAGCDDYPDELPGLWQAGIRAVVCLLNMPGAAAAYEAAGFAFHLLPIPDGGTASLQEFAEFCRFVEQQRASSHPVAVHCEYGVGRTGAMIAGYLVAHGTSPVEAVMKIRQMRPGAVETHQQWRFLEAVHELSQPSPNNPQS